jgi:hypothetical protein
MCRMYRWYIQVETVNGSIFLLLTNIVTAVNLFCLKKGKDVADLLI